MTTTLVENPWLTPEQAATKMAVSVATVLREARAGRLPHRRVGRQYRFLSSELDTATTPAPSTGARSVAGSNGSWRDEIAALDPYKAAKAS